MTSSARLAHDVVTAPGVTGGADPADKTAPAVFFAHGILGSRGNWKGFARRLFDDPVHGKALRRLRLVLLDLRNHGDSHGFAPPHTVEACAHDVAALVDDLVDPRANAAVVGHSFGGKVMLQLALTSTRPLAHAFILDAPPGVRIFHEGAGEEVSDVIRTVRGVPMPVESRRALVAHLTAAGLSDGIAQWMTTNLRAAGEGEGEGFVWRFDLNAVDAMLSSFGRLDLWPAVLAHRAPPALHLVRAGRGRRFRGEELQRVQAAVAAGVVTDHVMENAGHWLHTDDPDGLRDILAPVLATLAPA